MAKNRILFSNDFVLKNENVGINTTDPQALLDVNGTLKVSGVSTFSNISNFDNNVNIAGTVGIGTEIDIVAYDTLSNGTLSFEGSAGQLFSITNNLTSGSIFSVNDVSGIPSIDVDANGTIQLGPYGGNIGLGTTNPQFKLDVNGDARIANRESYFSAPGNLFSFPGLENDIKYVGSSYEIVEIKCSPDVAGSLNNTYFTLYGPAGIASAIDTTLAQQLVVIWFNVAGAGTTPSVVGAGRSVEIAIPSGASAVSIASSVATQMSTDAGFIVGNTGIGTVYFVANTPDDFSNPDAGTSGFAVTTTSNGSGTLSGTDKWYGGVLAPNGKIYGIPRDSTSVLVIDPATNTTSTFGSLSGNDKCHGGVLAPNGKIYGIPRNSTSVLVIDPATNTTSTFGSLSGTAKWQGGVLAPNGKIYGIPYQSTSVLVIDPETNTTSTFGSLGAANKWQGGVLAPNGKIYGIPSTSTSVLVIDPATNTTSTFGSLSGIDKWIGGVLAPNGKIYGIPRDSTSVLVIDPATNTTSTFGSLSGSTKWSGGVLAPNGKIYGIPRESTSVLSIGGGSAAIPDWYLSAYQNKY